MGEECRLLYVGCAMPVLRMQRTLEKQLAWGHSSWPVHLSCIMVMPHKSNCCYWVGTVLSTVYVCVCVLGGTSGWTRSASRTFTLRRRTRRWNWCTVMSCVYATSANFTSRGRASDTSSRFPTTSATRSPSSWRATPACRPTARTTLSSILSGSQRHLIGCRWRWPLLTVSQFSSHYKVEQTTSWYTTTTTSSI